MNEHGIWVVFFLALVTGILGAISSGMDSYTIWRLTRYIRKPR